MTIETKNIRKVFSTGQVETIALGGVSITVKDGEFVAIMGPSGCGKSSLLNILGLLDSPTSGSYLLDGFEVAQLRENERTNFRKGRIGFVFQSYNLLDDMTIEENVYLPMIYQQMTTTEKTERVKEILNKVGLGHRINYFPSQLSGGQQQRVAIARAVVCRPGLLLADEPTGNLDSKNGMAVMELLRELNNEGTTIVMVTHSLHDASFANRTINLYDGQIVDTLTDRL
jgi:putative ABC transport system ATP-binding protein